MVEKAVQSPDLASLLADSGMTVEEIVTRIQARLNDLLSVVAEELSVLEKAASALQGAQRQQDDALAQVPSPESLRRQWLFSFLWGAFVAVLATSLAAAIYDLTPTSAAFPVAVRTTSHILKVGSLIGVPLGILWMIIGAAYRRGKSQRVYSEQQEAIRNRSGVSGLEQQFRNLQERFSDAFYQRGILPEVTGILSNATTPSYATRLPDDAAGKGLSEAFTSAHEVKTQARQDLEELLKLPGGSIGLAGARGVGKTTLMTLVANRPVKDNQKPCSIMCPAPVEYPGRDYLVTLFVLLCNRVIQDKEQTAVGGYDPARGYERERNEAQRTRPAPLWMRPLAGLLRRTASFLLLIGTLLLVTATLIAIQHVSSSRREAAQKQTTQTAAPQPSAANDGHAPAKSAAPAASKNTQAPAAAANAEPQESVWRRLWETPAKLLQALGLEPPAMVKWGLSLVVAGWLCAFLWPWIVVQQEPGLEIVGSTALGIPRIVRRDLPGGSEQPSILSKARDHLESLRFQQSYTSGWSGALKLPFGVEAGINDAETLARNQRSLPELVQEFREFLQLLAAEYHRVVIGIDELDKLESDEKAHLFLNEIKAIFGISDVFYLVSVSENAVSAFERRGLPFRDVFDSSFDTIVHVDYLRLKESKQLLKRRTTRIPEPFLCLCHCLSGGLPRDLIRTCRDMLDIAEQEKLRDLLPLAEKVVSQEIHAKARAMTIAAAKVPAGAPQARFLSELTELLAQDASAQTLLDRAAQLLAVADESRNQAAKMPLGQDGSSSDGAKDLIALAELQSEFGLYLAYVATVLEMLAKMQAAPQWAPFEQDAGGSRNIFDSLAANRQVLAVSAAVGRERLVQLRSAQSLSAAISIPAAPTAAVVASVNGDGTASRAAQSFAMFE